MTIWCIHGSNRAFGILIVKIEILYLLMKFCDQLTGTASKYQLKMQKYWWTHCISEEVMYVSLPFVCLVVPHLVYYLTNLLCVCAYFVSLCLFLDAPFYVQFAVSYTFWIHLNSIPFHADFPLLISFMLTYFFHQSICYLNEWSFYPYCWNGANFITWKYLIVFSLHSLKKFVQYYTSICRNVIDLTQWK